MKEVNVTEIFACNVFNDSVMRERLPNDIYQSLKNTANEGSKLEKNVAQVVANEMKDWAMEKGATHYTHWFQPMTGVTAEKHDAFISPRGEGGVFMEFSGNELIKGEPDASSFPSGGLRATFEARGYTAWDPSSYAFVKDNALYIPTAFCSYMGESLDKKTPLLRSMVAINKQGKRLLKALGKEVSKVTPTVGAEQEYFLIDKDLYNKRKDLMCTGRTLFGARPPKGQELDDHYFANLKDRVALFMKDLDLELWKLGVYAKTKHNEAAPAQHELACVYTSCNIAADHNQLVMELMKKIANRHNLVCLLHEKPFDGVNGSGKHNNWSLSTSTGENLLSPGKEPENNKQFLLILSAVIKAVDCYADLLRQSVASAGNDHRLGGHEAPPAIISIYLGEELKGILEAIQKGECLTKLKTENLDIGLVENFEKDTTDRNRTSPFAFTGNKFEFRMLGSSEPISCVNTMLNTMVAEIFSQYADELEKVNDKDSCINLLIKSTMDEHGRVIFNGNNYTKEWEEEAKKRGLENLRTTVESINAYVRDKNIDLFANHSIFTKSEVYARQEIFFGSYVNTINIEVLTMSKMIKKDIIPASLNYSKEIANTLIMKKKISEDLVSSEEVYFLSKLSQLTKDLMNIAEELDEVKDKNQSFTSLMENATYSQNEVVPLMKKAREIVDELETIMARDYWPYPTYNDLLYTV